MQQRRRTRPHRSIGKNLTPWGFTPQKPFKRAYEQSPMQAWLRQAPTSENKGQISRCAHCEHDEVGAKPCARGDFDQDSRVFIRLKLHRPGSTITKKNEVDPKVRTDLMVV
jgi:hypothetical protein